MNIGDLISNKDWATAYLMLNNYDGEKEISDAEMSRIMRQYLNDLGLSKERIDSLMSVAESKPLVSGLFDSNNSETTASEEFMEQLSNIEDLYIEEFFDCDMTKYNIGGNVLNLLKLGYNMTNTDEGSLKYKVDEVDTALEVLDLLNNIVGSTPHGVLYSESLSEFIPNLEISLKLMIKNFTRTEITYEVLLEDKNYGIEYKPGFNNWLAGMSPLLNDDAVYEKWANGPDLKTLEQIYAQYPDFASKYMNDYLVWRVHYEANLKYYEDIKNIFSELTPEEENNISEFYNKTVVETTPDIAPSGKIILGTSNNETLQNLDKVKVPLTIKGFDGHDILSGSDFSDKLYGGSGNDSLYGGLGNDLLMGEYGNDSLYAGDDDDILYGGYGNDKLDGGAGNDILCGGMESDTLYGGAGADTYLFYKNFGDDVINEQNTAGTDTVIFGEGISPEDVKVTREGNDMVLKVKNNGTIRIYSQFVDSDFHIEFFKFADGTTLTADDYFNTVIEYKGSGCFSDYNSGFGTRDAILLGEDDNNTIHGLSGNDTLGGGGGSDRLYGGLGDDTYLFNLGDGADTINEQNVNSTADRVLFGKGITPENITVTRDGIDMVLKIGESDSLRIANQYTREGDQIEKYVFADGTVLTVQDLLDTVIEYKGSGCFSDYNLGFGTRDAILLGEDDNNTIHGLSGDDTLGGGGGSDWLYGGLGDDTYLFNLGDGADTIDERYADSANDKLVFGEGIYAEDICAVQSGNNLVLSILGTEDTITVKNHFSNPNCAVENFTLSDGRAITNVQLNQLIQSMASFENETGMLWNDAITQNNETAMSIIDNIWTQKPAV